MLKITGGQFRGRVLKAPKGEKTRPTSSMVRQRLFDILAGSVEGASVLDLFAGSGSLGIEALSRGAYEATFVERDRNALRCLEENLRSLQVEANVLRHDVLAALKKLAAQQQFDLIFMDPPYALSIEGLFPLLEMVLKPDGLLVVEQGKRSSLAPENFSLQDTREIGDTRIFFFTHLS